MKVISMIGSFAAGIVVALVFGNLLQPVNAMVPSSTPTMVPSSTPTMVPSSTPTMVPTLAPAKAGAFGWAGAVQCHNCTPFSATIRVTHYNPTLGDLNCWDWSTDFDYCMSNTYSGIPWESTWGYGAACPPEWPIGTWLDIPNVGYFVCFDRGGLVTCDDETRVCAVDLLGPGGADWDGKQFDITLWVPLKPRFK